MALQNKINKKLQNSAPRLQNRPRPDTKRSAAISGPGIKRTGAVMLLRKNKPKKSKIGLDKGEWRRVEGGWKRRRFTPKQRRTFRKGPISTEGNGPKG